MGWHSHNGFESFNLTQMMLEQKCLALCLEEMVRKGEESEKKKKNK